MVAQVMELLDSNGDGVIMLEEMLTNPTAVSVTLMTAIQDVWHALLHHTC